MVGESCAPDDRNGKYTTNGSKNCINSRKARGELVPKGYKHIWYDLDGKKLPLEPPDMNPHNKMISIFENEIKS